MKAFTVDAQWAPKPEYVVSEKELRLKRAESGSMVWKDPVFAVVDLPVPEIGDDDLLVKVKRCGICGSDSHLYETDRDNYIIFSGPVKLPCTIGHEYSGVVAQVGKNVKNFKIGDMIAAESIVWCGKCSTCKSGAFNQCDNVELAGITVDGALAEYVRVNERHCWKINGLAKACSDEDIFDIGALIEPIGCAYNGIFISGGGFKPGSTVVVYGAGPIGLGAIALARVAGADEVISFDVVPERLAVARKLGADHVYNFNDLKKSGRSPREVVMEHTGGRGAEVQVEAAGAAPITIPEMEKSLAVNGKIVYLARSAASAPIMLDIFVSGANGLVGSRGHSGYGIYPNIIRLIASGRLQVKDMITAIYDFKDVHEALKQSVARTDGKILVRID